MPGAGFSLSNQRVLLRNSVSTLSAIWLSGNTASTPLIAAGSTGRLSIDARSGRYAVHVRDRTVRAARVTVGPRRESSQNQLLLP